MSNMKRQGDTKTYSDAVVRVVVGDKMEFSVLKAMSGQRTGRGF